MPLFKFDEGIRETYQVTRIIGVDEVGRGPFAGPLMVAAIVLKYNFNSDKIRDSKLLSAKKRDIAFYEIIKNVEDLGICCISAKEIDKFSMKHAFKKAVKRAVSKVKGDIVLIDGQISPEFNMPSVCIKKGDNKSLSIASASIVAKVLRDKYMCFLSKYFPNYAWKKNKGYGTKSHIGAIQKFGITEFHRKTYIRNFYNKSLFVDL